MRLILEKNEIVVILGKHFDAELDPEKVIIRTDPFEIELSGLPLGSSSSDAPLESAENVPRVSPTALDNHMNSLAAEVKQQTLRAVQSRDDADAFTEPPPPGKDGIEGGADSIHPAAVLAASKELERQLDRENPKMARRSGRWSEVAPTDSKDEI